MEKRKTITPKHSRRNSMSRGKSYLYKTTCCRVGINATKPVIVEGFDEEGKAYLVVDINDKNQVSKIPRRMLQNRIIAAALKNKNEVKKIIINKDGTVKIVRKRVHGKHTEKRINNWVPIYDSINEAEIAHEMNARKLLLRYSKDIQEFLNRKMTFDEFRLACVKSKALCILLISNVIVYDGSVIKYGSDYIREASNQNNDNKGNKKEKTFSGNIIPPTNNNNGGSGDEEPEESQEYYEILSRIPTITVGDRKVYDTPIGGNSDESAGEALKRYALELGLSNTDISIITKINTADISKIFCNKLPRGTNKYKALIIALRLVPVRSNYILGKIGINLSFATSKEDRLLLAYIYTAPFDRNVTVKWCNENLRENGCPPLINSKG